MSINIDAVDCEQGAFLETDLQGVEISNKDSSTTYSGTSRAASSQNRALLRRVKAESALNGKEIFIATLTKYSQNPYNWSALSYAIYMKDLNAVRVLLNNGMDPNQSSQTGFVNMPGQPWVVMFVNLHLRGEKDRVSGGKYNQNCATIKDLNTVVYSDEERQIFQLLIDAGARPSSCPSQSTIVMHIAKSSVKMKWNECLGSFVKNFSEKDLSDLLYYSVISNNYKASEILLSLRENLDCRTVSYSLSGAIYAGLDLDIMKLLLEHGADPNHHLLKDQGGALSMAARSKVSEEKKAQAINLLLEYGAT